MLRCERAFRHVLLFVGSGASALVISIGPGWSFKGVKYPLLKEGFFPAALAAV